MNEGISKETLLGINPWQYDNQQDLLNAILGLCADLDPWLPIENTPKDKYILIFDSFAESQVVAKFNDKICSYLDRNRVAVYATHYKLLPDDPK